jgi:hypothetical protein
MMKMLNHIKAYRRNPVRAMEIEENRQSKLRKLRDICGQKVKYLAEHPMAKVDVARRAVNEKAKKLNMNNGKWGDQRFPVNGGDQGLRDWVQVVYPWVSGHSGRGGGLADACLQSWVSGSAGRRERLMWKLSVRPKEKPKNQMRPNGCQQAIVKVGLHHHPLARNAPGEYKARYRLNWHAAQRYNRCPQ